MSNINWLIPRFVTRLTRRVALVGQELPTLPKNMSSHLVFSGVRVTRSLALCSVLQIVVCPFVLFLLAIVFSILLRFRFWLPLCYLQTLLIMYLDYIIVLSVLLWFRFWLPLWYLQTLLIMYLDYIIVLSVLLWFRFWLPLWYLQALLT